MSQQVPAGGSTVGCSAKCAHAQLQARKHEFCLMLPQLPCASCTMVWDCCLLMQGPAAVQVVLWELVTSELPHRRSRRKLRLVP